MDDLAEVILQKGVHRMTAIMGKWVYLDIDPLCKYLTLLNLQPKKRMNHALLFTFLDSDCFYFLCQQICKLEFVKSKIASKGWTSTKPGGWFCFAGLFFYCQY